MVKIKLAIISDIHGNIASFNAIIDDAKSRKVDKFIIAGDLINELPFSNEVIDKVKEINALAVKGNKEEYLIEYDEKKYDWDNIQFKNSIFLFNSLSEENLEYVKKLPFSISLEYENVKLKIVHGSPESLTELVHKEDEDLIDKYTKSLEEDILIFGHTHESPWILEKNNKTIANSGCSGVSPNNPGYGEYLIVDIKDGKYKIEILKAKYNPEELKRRILDSGMLEIDIAFANLTYETLMGNPNLRKNFMEEAKNKMYQRGKELHKPEATGIYKAFKLYDDDIWLELTEKYKEKFRLKLEE